ncbi:MAG: STAS domain-containing protein, partial [Phycisphaeraceae bacterium]
YAVFVGVMLNIGLYLRQAAQLHLAQLVQERGGPLIERPLRDRSGEEKAMFLQVEGNLFFANADALDDELTSLTQSDVQVVILRLKRTHNVDATVMTVLEQFVDRMHNKGGHVLLCGVKHELHDRLRAYGLVDRVGEDNVFLSQSGIFTSAKQAVRRAREIVGSSIDEEDLFEEPNPPQPVTGA